MTDRCTSATACADHIQALSDALTQSRAETAAAYERAAGLATYTNAGLLDCDVPASFRAAIRALATPDQSATLDAVRAAARFHERQRAAKILQDYLDETQMGEDTREAIERLRRGVLSAPKGGV